MPVRDLGYKPYQGERLPPTHNTWVLLRHGLRRVWSSWLVKIAVFLGWVPAIVFVAVAFFAVRQAQGPEAIEELAKMASTAMVTLLTWQMWLFVTLASLGGGAGAIAEDLANRGFQFFFAKPVTPEQYLAGRIGAMALFCWGLMLFPALVAAMAIVALAPPDERLAQAGLLLPGIVHSTVVALTLATVSVGVSSFSRSRAFTMSAWVMVFIIPAILSTIVMAVSDWPWLALASLPSLLGTLAMELFRVDIPSRQSPIEWFHAAPALAAWLVASVAVAMYRLRRTEVVA